MEEECYLKNIKRGIRVQIATASGKSARGLVEEIATRKEYAENGIMVMLKTGEVGRIKKILSDKPETEIDSYLKKGENYRLEFKENALWSMHLKEQEIKESKSNELHTFRHKASKVIIAKSIAALMNSEGGNLVIGIKEKKTKGEYEVIGIDQDMDKLKQAGKEPSKDAYKRMLIDDIIRAYFPPKVFNHLNQYLSIEFQEHEGKLLCNISVKKSNDKIFLNLEGKKMFMIRTEAETRNLVDEELVDYCLERFRN